VIFLLGVLVAPRMAGPALGDASLKATKALPNGAANVTSAFLPTGKSTNALSVPAPDVEYVLTAPALTTGELADAATVKYDVLFSDAADGSGPTTYIAAALTQTGAGGAGAAGSTFRFRVPSNGGSYVGIKATNSGAGNQSGKNYTLEALV
jgi:hypothetical protein